MADKENIVDLETLMSEAHQRFRGDFSISTKLVELDKENNFCLFKARVEVHSHQTCFDGYGDACPSNLNNMVLNSYIRMAETRAIVRALRWATNMSKTAKEEMEE